MFYTVQCEGISCFIAPTLPLLWQKATSLSRTLRPVLECLFFLHNLILVRLTGTILSYVLGINLLAAGLDLSKTDILVLSRNGVAPFVIFAIAGGLKLDYSLLHLRSVWLQNSSVVWYFCLPRLRK